MKGRKKRGTPVISKAVFTLAKFRDNDSETPCTCLGHLGRCDRDRNDPISVTLPKVAIASTIVTVLCRCHRCYHLKSPMYIYTSLKAGLHYGHYRSKLVHFEAQKNNFYMKKGHSLDKCHFRGRKASCFGPIFQL